MPQLVLLVNQSPKVVFTAVSLLLDVVFSMVPISSSTHKNTWTWSDSQWAGRTRPTLCKVSVTLVSTPPDTSPEWAPNVLVLPNGMEIFTIQMELTSRHWKTTKLPTEQSSVSQVPKHGTARPMVLLLKLNAIFLVLVPRKRSSLPIMLIRSRPKLSPKVPTVQLLQLVTRSWLPTNAWLFQICI